MKPTTQQIIDYMALHNADEVGIENNSLFKRCKE